MVIPDPSPVPDQPETDRQLLLGVALDRKVDEGPPQRLQLQRRGTTILNDG